MSREGSKKDAVGDAKLAHHIIDQIYSRPRACPNYDRVIQFNYARGTTLTFKVRVLPTETHTMPTQTLTSKVRVQQWLGCLLLIYNTR